MYFLLIQAKFLFCFYSVLNYLLLFSVRITNIRPNFIFGFNRCFYEIPAQFDAKTIEDKWYDYWMKNNYFHSEPDHRTPIP
jgi:hypothetical protein